MAGREEGVESRTFFGEAGGHFGEVLQGAFEGPSGALRPGLVTLPIPVVGARAAFSLRETPGILVSPRDRVKARRAAEVSLGRWGGGGGELVVEGRLPVARGMGSSTSEVVAAVRAVARACGVEPLSGEVARLAVEAEGASDPIMFDEAVLFDQRSGEVVFRLGGPLPRFVVLGFDAGGPNGVPTDSLGSPGYSRREVAVFASLLDDLRGAVEHGDLAKVAEVSTESARMNHKRLPNPFLEEATTLAGRTGALGVAAAHSGTVTGLLFDPADREGPSRALGLASRDALRGVLCLGTFRTGALPARDFEAVFGPGWIGDGPHPPVP